jgi:hypothetical protein
MASPNNGSAGNQKGQEKILIYSKTLTVAEIMSKPYAYKAGSEEPLAPLPEGSSLVEVEVVGLESGKKLCKDSWKKGIFCAGGGFKKVPIDYRPPEEERVRQERIVQCRAAWEGNPTQEQLCIGKV